MIFDQIKSPKDFDRLWAQVETDISGRDDPFEDTSDAAKEARKKCRRKSIWEMARIYFPDYVRNSSAGFHARWEKISRTIDEPVLVEAFRGAGKSTFFTFLDPVHAILFRIAPAIYCSLHIHTTRASFFRDGSWPN